MKHTVGTMRWDMYVLNYYTISSTGNLPSQNQQRQSGYIAGVYLTCAGEMPNAIAEWPSSSSRAESVSRIFTNEKRFYINGGGVDPL